MAARRIPARNPDPDRRVSLLSILYRCQDQAARFTMLPANYNVYDKIMREFLGQVIPYEEFQRRMGWLLQNPRYDHLRIFYDVVRRRVFGEEQEDDGPLFLYPVVIVVLLYSFLSSVQLGETLWDDIEELDIGWAREWSRLRNRRYHPGYYVAGEDPISDPVPNLNLEDFFRYFLNWCQDQAARMTMLPEDYRLYERITFDFYNGRTDCDDLENEMGELLRDPTYEDLRVWWNVFLTGVNDGTLMEQNPSYNYPLHLCVRLNISNYRSLFGDSLWSS